MGQVIPLKYIIFILLMTNVVSHGHGLFQIRIILVAIKSLEVVIAVFCKIYKISSHSYHHSILS